MKEECLICKAPLEYLETDVIMEYEICHKKENSKTRCVNGHYVCNDCHNLRRFATEKRNVLKPR